jgi:hypothetical protein
MNCPFLFFFLPAKCQTKSEEKMHLLTFISLLLLAIVASADQNEIPEDLLTDPNIEAW